MKETRLSATAALLYSIYRTRVGEVHGWKTACTARWLGDHRSKMRPKGRSRMDGRDIVLLSKKGGRRCVLTRRRVWKSRLCTSTEPARSRGRTEDWNHLAPLADCERACQFFVGVWSFPTWGRQLLREPHEATKELRWIWRSTNLVSVDCQGGYSPHDGFCAFLALIDPPASQHFLQ